MLKRTPAQLSLTLALLFSGFSLQAQQKTMAPAEFVSWLPVTDAERQLKAPAVDKDAGAEILQWRVRVVDEILSSGDLQRVLYNYIRVKVFDEKGKIAASTVDLPYRSPGNINDISGRTIKADGSIVELDAKTVYRRDQSRVGIKQTVVSFAMPGVEAGSIVEYRWRQIQDDNNFRYLRLQFARDLPVQKVTYFVRPLSSDYVATERMFIAPFNCQPTPMKMNNEGWNETTVVNVAASRDEPYAPSKPNLEPWALLYYSESSGKNPEKYWNDVAKDAYGDMKASVKISDELKTAAAKIKESASTDDEKIAAMIDVARQNLRSYFAKTVTDAERKDFVKKLPKGRNRTSAEIFKSGIALDSEMNTVVAALATQLGMEVRPALVPDLDEIDFDPNQFTDSYFLDIRALAIKQGDSWRVFDVSRRHLKPGMLSSDSEGVVALVADTKAIFVITKVTDPKDSSERRTATLKLNSDGTLEGDVKESYTGHRAALYRSSLDGESEEQQQDWFKEEVTGMFAGSKATDIKFANLTDSSKPLEISYHLVAPQFAQVTGRRILFEPHAFRRSDTARFTASDRKYPIRFRYGWHELDELKITLPQGFSLENAEAPGSMDFGDPGSYNVSITTTGQEVTVRRELTFGNKALLKFASAQYPALKRVFESVHVSDTTSLSLRGNE